MRFHRFPMLDLAGKNDRSNSSHRPTLPPILSTSTTLVPRWRRLLATSSLLRSSKESNRLEARSLRIWATAARRRARRLARVKSASTCSFRFIYGIIFQPSQKWVYEIRLRSKRNRGKGLWEVIQPSDQLGSLPGQHEQDEVGHDGQGDAQDYANQQPEQAPSSHPLNAFRGVGHGRVATLHLEVHFLHHRFQVGPQLRFALLEGPSQGVVQPRKTGFVIHAQKGAPSVLLDTASSSNTRKGERARTRRSRPSRLHRLGGAPSPGKAHWSRPWPSPG